jgi:arginase family enzyme
MNLVSVDLGPGSKGACLPQSLRHPPKRVQVLAGEHTVQLGVNRAFAHACLSVKDQSDVLQVPD